MGTWPEYPNTRPIWEGSKRAESVVVEVPYAGPPDTCKEDRHVFRETNIHIRGGHSTQCRCGKLVLRLYGKQDITRDSDPLILWDVEVYDKGWED